MTSLRRELAPKRKRSGVIHRGPRVSYTTTSYWLSSFAVRMPPAGLGRRPRLDDLDVAERLPAREPDRDAGDPHPRSAEGVLRLGHERRIDAEGRDGRDRRVARLGSHRLGRERADLARRVLSL